MTLDEAKKAMVKFVELKTTLRPAFVDPILKAEEVKRGHWIAHGKSIIGIPVERCSECAEWSCGFNQKYCPKCGAKMEDDDETDRC